MSRPSPFARATLVLALAAVLGLSACGSSGRALRDPERDVTSPTRSVPTTVPPISLPPLPLGTGPAGTVPPAAPGVFAISSSAFEAGGAIPAAATCAGPSPALRWQAPPEGTTELALVVSEQGDGGDVHWLVTGISPTSEGVEEGQIPIGAVQLTNSLGEATWSAPCPPPGTPQTINFSLLALTQPAAVPAGTPATDAFRLLTEQADGNIAALTATATPSS